MVVVKRVAFVGYNVVASQCRFVGKLCDWSLQIRNVKDVCHARGKNPALIKAA